MNTICSVTSTICRLMGIHAPAHATAPTVDEAIQAASQKGIEKIEKCLVYAPDAIGTVRYEADPDAFARKITEAILQKMAILQRE